MLIRSCILWCILLIFSYSYGRTDIEANKNWSWKFPTFNTEIESKNVFPFRVNPLTPIPESTQKKWFKPELVPLMWWIQSPEVRILDLKKTRLITKCNARFINFTNFFFFQQVKKFQFSLLTVFLTTKLRLKFVAKDRLSHNLVTQVIQDFF